MASMSRALWVVALVLVAASCGGDDSKPADVGNQVDPSTVACPSADLFLCDRTCACLPEGASCTYEVVYQGRVLVFDLGSWGACLAAVETDHQCNALLTPVLVGCPLVSRYVP